MYQAKIELIRLGKGEFYIKDSSTGDVAPSFRTLSVRKGEEGIKDYEFHTDEIYFKINNNQVYIVNFTAGVPTAPDNFPTADLSFMILDAAEDFLLSEVSELYCNCSCKCKDYKRAEKVSKIIAFIEASELRFEKGEPAEAQRILTYLNEMQGVGSCKCKCK